MVAFLVWGNKPGSFAVANGSLLDYQDMPEDYVGKFKMFEWNAMQIRAFTTGPSAYHWMLKVDQSWAARGPSDMLPYLKTELTSIQPNGFVGMGRGLVTSVAFAPDGTSWFIRYSSNTCLWGPERDNFSPTWQALIKELEETHPRKDECIDFVAFGLHDLLMVRFENGNSAMFLPDDPTEKDRISKHLIKEVEERLAAGWTLEWKRGSSVIFSYAFGPGQEETLARVESVLNGVGNDAAAVANAEAAQLIAATAGYNQQLTVSRWLTR